LKPSNTEQNVWIVPVGSNNGEPTVSFPEDMNLLDNVYPGDHMVFIQTEEGWEIKIISEQKQQTLDYVDV
jgi:hypothetical protein